MLTLGSPPCVTFQVLKDKFEHVPIVCCGKDGRLLSCITPHNMRAYSPRHVAHMHI